MPYHHFAHYHLPRLGEIRRVYWANTLNQLGSSLVAIFVPIFLLKLGFSFYDVLVYLLFSFIFSLLLQYPASRLFSRIHAHRIMAAGSVAYAVFFAFLSTLPQHKWPLLWLAFLWAAYKDLYWTAFHYIFSSARAHRKSGRQIAGSQALAMLAATTAPAIGGIIASQFGISYSYLAAIVVLIAGLAPMLTSRSGGPPKAHIYLPWHEFAAMRRDLYANAFNGMLLVAELDLWPLLIFTLVSSYAGIGLLSSVIALSSIAVTLYVGKRQQKSAEQEHIRQGLATYSLASLGRTAVQNAGQVFGINLLAGVGRSLYVTPFIDRYYHNSDGAHRLGYIMMMESAYAAGSAIFTIALMLLASLFDMTTVLAVGVGSVAVTALGIRLIR